MHTILFLAAIYGTLNAETNLVKAPPTVRVGNTIRVTEHITEQQANSIGYQLVLDEPPTCASNEYAVATGWAVTAPSATIPARIHRTYEVRPIPPAPYTPRRIYKYDLSTACIEYGEITNLITLISADAGTKWMWDCAEILVENDPYFIAATNEVVQGGIIDEPKVRAILDRAYELGQTAEVSRNE